jgi:hypothetical protein
VARVPYSFPGIHCAIIACKQTSLRTHAAAAMVKLCAYITLLQRSRIQMCTIHMFRAAINIALLGMQIDRPRTLCRAAAMSMNIYNL